MALCSVCLTVYLRRDKDAKFGAVIDSSSLWKGTWKLRVGENKKHVNGKNVWVRTMGNEVDMKTLLRLKYGFIKKVFSSS